MKILVSRYFGRRKSDFKRIKQCAIEIERITNSALYVTNICEVHSERTHLSEYRGGGCARSRDCVTAASRIHYVTSLSLLQTRRKATEWIFISNEDTGAHKEKFLLVSTPSASPLAGFSGNVWNCLRHSTLRFSACFVRASFTRH